MTNPPERKTWIDRNAGWLGVVILAVAIVVPLIGITADVGDVTFRFRALALSATILGALAALVQLWAPGGRFYLDGFGKMLGFAAALLAFYAVFMLLLLPLVLLGVAPTK